MAVAAPAVWKPLPRLRAKPGKRSSRGEAGGDWSLANEAVSTRADRAPALAAEAGEADFALQAVAFQEALHCGRPELQPLGGQRLAQPLAGQPRPRLQDVKNALAMRLDPRRGGTPAHRVGPHMAAFAKAFHPMAEAAFRQPELPRGRGDAHTLLQHGRHRRAPQVLAYRGARFRTGHARAGPSVDSFPIVHPSFRCTFDPIRTIRPGAVPASPRRRPANRSERRKPVARRSIPRVAAGRAVRGGEAGKYGWRGLRQPCQLQVMALSLRSESMGI